MSGKFIKKIRKNIFKSLVSNNQMCCDCNCFDNNRVPGVEGFCAKYQRQIHPSNYELNRPGESCFESRE